MKRGLALAFACLVLVACDPGGFLAVQNDSPDPVVVVFEEGATREYYEVPANGMRYIKTQVGGFSGAQVAVRDTNCRPIDQAVALASIGPSLVQIDAGAVTVSIPSSIDDIKSWQNAPTTDRCR